MMIEDVTIRRREVLKIMTHLKKNGQRINRYTVKDQLDKSGFDMSVSTIYRDMTVINRENTWVRDLSESNYSAYQEDISNNLEWVIHQAITQFEKTKNHVWLNIMLKAQETKMKHTNGENINISAALLGKKFKQLKKELDDKKTSETQTNPQEESMINVIDICKQQQSGATSHQ